MNQSIRAVPLAALLVLVSGQATALAVPPLAVKAAGGQSRLMLGDTEVVNTQGRIAHPQTLTFPGSTTVLLTWDQYQGPARTSGYALSFDGGQTVTQVATTENKVRLRYATFDPLAGAAPLVDPALQASADNRLYLVQFVATPLEEMRAGVRGAGGEVLRFLTDNTHLVRMSPETRDAVAALPYVRWVGAFHPAYRVDETVRAALVARGSLPEARYSIECLTRGPGEQQAVAAAILKLGGTVHTISADQYRMEATLDRAQLLAVLQRNEVNFVDPIGPMTPDMDLIRQTGGAVPLLSGAGFLGQGVRGEVFDGGMVTNHEQWNGQAPLVHGAAIAADAHGNACYGINFATGTGNAQATGLCPQREQGMIENYTQTNQSGLGTGAISRLTLNTEAVNAAGTYRSCYQTSSVGSPQITNYSTVSAEVDDYLFQVDYLSCQSQSNTGNRTSRPQAWAKNILSVGGLALQETINKDDDTWNTGASIGPAQDLRVKPDLSHSWENIFTSYSTATNGYGQFGGTSGATPITAGHAGLLMQMWHQGVFTVGGVASGGGASVFADRPKSQTAKALMINGAYRYPINQTSTGTPFTNNMFRARVGWGIADMTRLYNDRTKHYIVNQTDILTNGQTATHNLNVGSGESEFRATMIYPDPMGNTAAAQQRINDLTLKVTDPNNVVYWGNNGMVPLNINDTGGANYSVSGGAANTYDTVENVFIKNPVAGTWKVEVIASQIVQDGYLTTPGLDAVYSLVVANVTAGPPPALFVSVPNGVPNLVPPGAPFSVNVDVNPGSQNVAPGSPTAWYRYSGGSFISFPLTSTGGTHYRADFPAPLCVNTPQFYFTAAGDLGGTASSPSNAPAGFYSTAVGATGTTTVMTESFEGGLPAGWTGTGLWHVGSTCAPGGSCDGVKWAYYGQDATCTFNNGVANNGLLTSAPIVIPTVPTGGSVTLQYCSAKISENLASYDQTTVLVNGTTTVDTAGEAASFETRTVNLTAYAGQTITLSWKFDTIDAINNDYRGWHVDNVRITRTATVCTDPVCYANCDASTSVPVLNVADFTCFLQKYAANDPYANCDASTSPPTLNVADFTCFLQKYAAGCP